jgi:hypothetical protein
MARLHQVLRIGILCVLLLLAIGQPDASPRGLCSMYSCDCTSCDCIGMSTCCESVCGECWADINDPNSPNYLACNI